MSWRMALLGLLVAAPVLARPDVTDWSIDEDLLREHRLPTQGAALLRILRERTPSADLAGEFERLVPKLSADAYADRVKASADLIKLGPATRPLLEKRLLDKKMDAETASRLRHALKQFPAERDNAIAAAAARLIARDKPADSLTFLFSFVPHATNEVVRQEVQRAINATAFVDKKPSPMVLEMLEDANPAKYAAAAEALVRGARVGANDRIAPLLRDPHPLVRHQLGTALIEKHDPRGVRILIDSLADSPPERADYALELLCRVAGDDAPVVVPRGKASASACRDAWLAWYAKNQASIDLVKSLARDDLGFTVVCSSGIRANAPNRIFELAADHQTVRWEFNGPRYPIDMQLLGGNRMLIAEYFDRRVSERDFKGNLLWEYAVTMPVACQRLPNGQTFIATRQHLVIVDREGKEVFTCFQQNTNITTAQRLASGEMVVVTTGGRCHLLDSQGRESKSFQMGPIYTLGGNIEILPNGRILAPQYSQNCIAEFDWQGNKHWQVSVKRPISVTRLKNGNTLVICSLDHRVVELNADGAEVWSYQADGRPFRARRR